MCIRKLLLLYYINQCTYLYIFPLKDFYVHRNIFRRHLFLTLINKHFLVTLVYENLSPPDAFSFDTEFRYKYRLDRYCL